MLCVRFVTKCSASRAIAHILGRPVWGQHKAGIYPCIVINKNDDSGYDLFDYIHIVEGGAAAGTRACASNKVRVRPEAPRRSFRPEARGARPGSAPRCASATPGRRGWGRRPLVPFLPLHEPI